MCSKSDLHDNCDRLVLEMNVEKKKSQKGKSKALEGRKQLGSVRVIQRNLVYVVGLPLNFADEDVIATPFFCLYPIPLHIFPVLLLLFVLVCSYSSIEIILVSMVRCRRCQYLEQQLVPYNSLQIVHAVCRCQASDFNLMLEVS